MLRRGRGRPGRLWPRSFADVVSPWRARPRLRVTERGRRRQVLAIGRRRPPAGRELTVHSDRLSDGLSPYALMSVGDGDLIKAVLLNAGVRRRGRGLPVPPMGAGLSTLSFSAILSEAGIPFHWLALGYDRGVCAFPISPPLPSRP